MSMATYVGLNFTVKLNEYATEAEVEIDYVFSDEETRDNDFIRLNELIY